VVDTTAVACDKKSVQDAETVSSPARDWRWWLRLLGISIINIVLIAIIVGLVWATWLPAYVYSHPDKQIGQSTAK
jgi:hypothetical protein